MEWGVLETVTAVVLVAVVPTFGPLIECFGTAGAAAPSRGGWSSSPSSCSPSGPTR